MSYGSDLPDLYRRAASYVDKILKGERPGELPLQSAEKFELVVNLKAATALGLIISEAFLVRADERHHLVEGHAAHAGDTWCLVRRGREADMRVEPAARRGDEVHRHRRGVAWIGIAQRLHPRADRIRERRVARALIRPVRGHAVVRLRRGGGP